MARPRTRLQRERDHAERNHRRRRRRSRQEEEEEEEEEDEQVPRRRSPRSRILSLATGKSDLRTLMEDEKSITKKKNENKRTEKPCHSRTNQNLPLRMRAAPFMHHASAPFMLSYHGPLRPTGRRKIHGPLRALFTLRDGAFVLGLILTPPGLSEPRHDVPRCR